MKVLRLVSTDDWEGLYVGDELIAQGHSLSASTVLEAIKDFKKSTIRRIRNLLGR